MRRKFYISLYLLFWLCVVSCQNAVSQTTKNDSIGNADSNLKIIAVKPNLKYGLSIVYYSDSEAEANYLKIRNDKTGKEYGLFQIEETGNDEVWSPDEEFLVLCNSYDLDLFKSSALLKLLSKPEVTTENFFEKAQSFDEISILNKQKQSVFRHSFIKWENNASISFTITFRDWNEVTKNNEVGSFRYDFIKKSLYRKTKNVSRLSLEEKNLYKVFFRLIGENKKGVIYQKQIKNEI